MQTQAPGSFPRTSSLIVLGDFLQNGLSCGERYFVVIEYERMRLKSVALEENGLRLQYGGQAKNGSYSTVLQYISHVEPRGCIGWDEDEEQISISYFPPQTRRMGVVPAEAPTEDNLGCVGRHFGYLTVLSLLGWAGRHRLAKCVCICGGEKIARVSSLRSGVVISCGCARGGNNEECLSVGEKYGELTILCQVERPEGVTKKQGYYRVKCSCGTEQVWGRARIVVQKHPDCGCRGLPALAGKRYGKLVVLGEYRRENRKRMMKVRCDCGNETFVSEYAMRIGKTKSCGCLKKGRKSTKIA